MSSNVLLVNYNGKWETMPDTGRVYVGGKTRSLMVEKTVTYSGLVKAICELLKVDSNKHKIQLACRYRTTCPTQEVKLCDDYAVKCFVHYLDRLKDDIIPIGVTLTPCCPSCNPVTCKALPLPSSMRDAQVAYSPLLPGRSDVPTDACSSTSDNVQRGKNVNTKQGLKNSLTIHGVRNKCQFKPQDSLKNSKDKSLNRVTQRKDVFALILEECSIDISYCKTWRARKYAFGEFAEESFAILPSFCEQLEKENPGTITAIETDKDNHFKYFFMSLGPCLRGFQSHIRKVIAVDAAFIRGKCFGTILVAVCLDGNNETYPLAFGVGDSENDASWLWFFTKLRDAIGNVEELVIISDRHKSIEKAVNNIFPTAHHGVCCWHLKSSILTKFKNGSAEDLYWKAAKACRQSDFNEHINKLQAISNDAYEYLCDIGFPKWARLHCTGRHYNIMTIDIAKSMNSIFKYASALPITTLAEYIRATLQKWFDNHRSKAWEMLSHLTRWAESKIVRRDLKSRTWSVNRVSINIFQVCPADSNKKESLVDFEARTCHCGKWQLSKLPCVHVMAVCKFMALRLSDCYIWCDNVYNRKSLVAAYSEPIRPLGPYQRWVSSSEVQDRVVLPPIAQSKPSGCPGDQRIPVREAKATTAGKLD